jgi:transcriptional regulator with XRE-family HTH domain
MATVTRVPNLIRGLRTSRGMSLSLLAAAIGVHESTVSRWESGESGIPDDRKVQLADFFDVSVIDMMGWSEPDGDDGSRMAA